MIFLYGLLVFQVFAQFLAQLPDVRFHQVFKVIRGAFGNALGILLQAVLDVLVEHFQQVQPVVKILGRFSMR